MVHEYILNSEKVFVRKRLQRQHIFLFELNYLLNVMQMDDATMMEEILNRPETTIQQKTLSLLESNSEKLRTTELDVIRFEGLRAGHSGGDYYDEDGGTDRQEAMEVKKLLEQRQSRLSEINIKTQAMIQFVQRNRQSLGFN